MVSEDLQKTYLLLADGVLLLHVLFVLFIVAGQLLIVIGGYRRWAWVRNRWFRWLHLLGIGIVVAESWVGLICPLTTLEMWLRESAGQAGYTDSFMQYWLGRLLYYSAPAWVFVAVYTGFAALVVVSWWWFPPRKPSDSSDMDSVN
jgi:hypothetical protein